jgi:hypothetical protein
MKKSRIPTSPVGRPAHSRPATHYISCDTLFIVQHAIDHRLEALNKLHWDGFYVGATDPFYRNIAIAQSKLEAARLEVGKVYESQFVTEGAA